MSRSKATFIKKSKAICFDMAHRQTIGFNMSRYDAAVSRGLGQFADMQKAREKASAVKQHVLDHLSPYLQEFEKNAQKNGIEVLWAEDREEAMRLTSDLLKQHKVEMLVKSKSMTTEELEFNEYLEKQQIESIETDLGEFIVQVAGEKPYHIVTPVMHKSRKDIGTLFHEKYGIPADSTPEYMTNHVREYLRDKFTTAGAGITGANFLLAREGAVALTENEGNGIMSTSFPRVHIAIAGIEKLIPSMDYLPLFWPLLSTRGTGQKITAYNSVLSGPARSGEKDGPGQMYVILLDNKRSQLYADKTAGKALKCIRCGACLNACPVYKNIGGYTYGSVYGGPIGSIITPHLGGFRQYNHLSFASSLCGKCAEVCPVKIDIPAILLHNRQLAVERRHTGLMWDTGMKMFRRVAGSRNMMDMVGGRLKNVFFSMGGQMLWGPRRKLPRFSNMSYSRKSKKYRNFTS